MRFTSDAAYLLEPPQKRRPLVPLRSRVGATPVGSRLAYVAAFMFSLACTSAGARSDAVAASGPHDAVSHSAPGPVPVASDAAPDAASDAPVDSDPAGSPLSASGLTPGADPLPRLTLEAVGLHVGGGQTDAATREAYKRLLEAHHPVLQECYVHANDPERGGVYGVDLLVETAGGPPLIRDVRTGLGGEEFRLCLRHAFERLEFPPPKGGAQVISYSVRFSLTGLR